MFYGWAPIVNEAANVRYLSGGAASAPVAFHVMAGSRRGGGAQHEHTAQAMLQNVPGLRVIAPGTPAGVDAAFHAALTGGDPTVIIDQIQLGNYEGAVPDEPADISGPMLLRDGADALIVSYSLTVQHALAAAELLAAAGIGVAVLDVPTLNPLPAEALIAATQDHRALLFVDESRAAASPASHMLARVLEARPLTRARLVCTLDAPAPFATHLLDEIAPTPVRIAAELRRVRADLLLLRPGRGARPRDARRLLGSRARRRPRALARSLELRARAHERGHAIARRAVHRGDGRRRWLIGSPARSR
jgi:pyruvate/2-oxoglutarate/acetoin dehydrogenase E1 component